MRYAAAGTVVGGFSRLLTHAEKELSPDKWITFANLTLSSGELYLGTGFTEDKDRNMKPDYSYAYKGRRTHKFNFRRKRFRDDPLFLYDSEMTETQLARLNGLNQIWDAGKVRYVKQVTTR